LNLADAQSEPGLGDGVEIHHVYVLATHHGRGLGRLLVERALEAARDSGLAYVWLGVWERNTKAIDFYRRCGFEIFGEHTFHLAGEAQRDLLMRRGAAELLAQRPAE